MQEFTKDIDRILVQKSDSTVLLVVEMGEMERIVRIFSRVRDRGSTQGCACEHISQIYTYVVSSLNWAQNNLEGA